ncbi:hypothetical protein GCM10011386_30540 [Parapedobacter defluvii]|uniref:Peptidase C39 domain-containing protein n=2 Tax=Parapedobacter defluvii TaxID=2045106 RepID=A0ABQ1M864_9SPHI|nr:hypothetical protein GCM10011386_30540 [Parapedobacter defluvii]
MENPIHAAYVLARSLDVPISRTMVADAIETHPDYPSLLAISEGLHQVGVINSGLRISAEQLSDVKPPFIAQVRNTSGQMKFTVVQRADEMEVEYMDTETGEWTKQPRASFLDCFSGVILLAVDEKLPIEHDYSSFRKKERQQVVGRVAALTMPLLVACTLAMYYVLGPFPALDNGWANTIYLLLAVIGVYITLLLVWYEADTNNLALRQVCSGDADRSGCSALLESKGANISGTSWAKIGFSYFLGAFLMLATAGLTNMQVLPLLSVISLLATTYIVFSLYYQWRVARQWCRLCLATLVILALQAGLALYTGSYNYLGASQGLEGAIIDYAIFASLVFIAVQLLIPALKAARLGRSHWLSFTRLKHDPGIFQAILSQQPTIMETTHGLGITLGNADAKHKIVKVCNPYCGPCSKAHVMLESILATNPEVQLQIIFTATDSQKDMRAAPVKHLMAIAEKRDDELTQRAIDDWYRSIDKDYAAFATRYPMNGELEKQGLKLKAMAKWCVKTGISFTPTIFVNGYHLPEIYTANDLKYLLTK